jgi:ribosomal protein S27AE
MGKTCGFWVRPLPMKKKCLISEVTSKMSELRIKFDRVTWKKRYDKKYFKKKAVCPLCGVTILKHHLKRHMSRKICRKKQTIDRNKVKQ